MYKSLRLNQRALGDKMTFRTSDILIGGSLIIIGLTEVAHLAGCLLGWSFLTVTDLMLAEIVIMVIAAILFSLIRHKKAVAVTVIAGKTAPEKKKVLRTQQILTGILAFFILLQILRILTGERAWLDGDMTLETVNTFLKENAIYTVDPLTGVPYTVAMPLRLRILCLPTLYGAVCRWMGMGTADVVYRLIPCVTLLLGYAAYGRLGAVIFGEDGTKRKTFLLIVGILFVQERICPAWTALIFSTELPRSDDPGSGTTSVSDRLSDGEKVLRRGPVCAGGSLYGVDSVRCRSLPACDAWLGRAS